MQSVTAGIETVSERAVRLAHERMLIEEAQADLREGRLLDDAEFDAWLDRFDSDLSSSLFTDQ